MTTATTPPHGCGEDMPTPQKCLPTRHYPQKTSDNRRSARECVVICYQVDCAITGNSE